MDIKQIEAMSIPEGERIAALETQITALISLIAELKADIKQIKEQMGWIRLVHTSIGGVVGSAVTFLLIEYLKKI